uniref:Uncharacterized protein n=1 Tax=Anopheles darlingi TaxID=43151 RepID=A0A2M4DLP6_ANODA
MHLANVVLLAAGAAVAWHRLSGSTRLRLFSLFYLSLFFSVFWNRMNNNRKNILDADGEPNEASQPKRWSAYGFGFEIPPYRRRRLPSR